MKKLSTTIFCMFMAAVSWAYDVEVDGIYYNLNETNKTAEVTSGDNRYEGDIVLPEKFTYFNVEYTVTSIAERAFFGGDFYMENAGIRRVSGSLTSITIPSSVTKIGELAFFNNPRLKKIHIPYSVNEIGKRIISCCDSIAKITVDNRNIVYDSRDNCNAIIRKNSNELIFGCYNSFIPATVKAIEKNAFEGCSELVSIFIPASVETIGENPFHRCVALASIEVDINNPMFESPNHCNAILRKEDKVLIAGCKNTIIPSNVKSIANIAFYGCRDLTSIVVPGSVEKLDDSSFAECLSLSSVTCLSCIPYTNYGYMHGNPTIFVPKESLNAYRDDDQWRGFTNILPIGGEEYYASFDNALYVENKAVRTNHEATLSLKMKNNVPITGFQCDVVMPEGVSIAMEDDEFYMIDLSTERTTAQKTNTFDSALQPDGSVRVLCGSTKNYTFSGNDGEVATIKINVADDVKGGEYFVLLKNIVMSDATGKTYKTDYVASILTAKEYDLGDANNDFEVNIGDYTTIANHILGNDGPVFVEKAADVNCDNEINVGDLTAVANLILYGSSSGQNAKSIMHKASTDPAGYDNLIYIASESMKAGEKKDFSVQMKNAVPMTGFQFDIEMPEGITVDMDDDFYCISLSTERTTARKTNTFDSALQPDGTVRVLCGSTKSYTFDGSDGEVAVISVKAADDVKAGNYTMKLKNIVMSDATGKTYKVDCSDVAITVTGTTGITSVSGNEVMNDGKYIINNRLVIKRGDRMYNALGELVK